jgi:hypothetical protein
MGGLGRRASAWRGAGILLTLLIAAAAIFSSFGTAIFTTSAARYAIQIREQNLVIWVPRRGFSSKLSMSYQWFQVPEDYQWTSRFWIYGPNARRRTLFLVMDTPLGAAALGRNAHGGVRLARQAAASVRGLPVMRLRPHGKCEWTLPGVRVRHGKRGKGGLRSGPIDRSRPLVGARQVPSPAQQS